jgi:twitching motility protein PilT
MNSSGVLLSLCEEAKMLGASDLHVVADRETRFRIQGILEKQDAIVPETEVETLIGSANDVQRARYEKSGFIDFAFQGDTFGRIRVSGHKTHQGLALVCRFLPEKPLPFENLHMPEVVKKFADKPSGLVLFSGMTGSGKTTLQASLIDHINKTSGRRIITFEDPIEFVFESGKSMITQCEVGQHVASFAEGLRGAMRADPEVIVLGEMRDTDTVEAALAAAETGHLVFGTIHTAEASHFADRMLGFFEAAQHDLVRTQLAQTLVGVVGMNLVRKKDGKSRRAAVEILVGTPGVRAQIQSGKTPQLRNTIATGLQDGMQTLERHLSELIRGGHISLAEAQSVSKHHDEITASSAAA